MKIFLSMLLLLACMQGSAQRKNKTDPRDAQIDTLNKTNKMLTMQVDSLSKDRALYYGLYEVIKEKVLLTDFNPARFDMIVDSVRSSRDSATILAGAPVAALRDSLSTMTSQNMQLKEKVDSLSLITADKSKLMNELKDLKSLLDAKIITQVEYDEKKRLVMSKWQ
jgi:hypothetical protein